MKTLHATETQLALFQTGELGLVERLRVQWHVNSCERCANELAAFEETHALMEATAGELPAGVDWERLSAEMAANIHLGVEAGECVRPAKMDSVGTRRPAQLSWRTAWASGLAVAGVVLVVYSGTFLLSKKMGESAKQRFEEGVVLEVRPDALEIREKGAAFSLVQASTGGAAISVGSGGSLKARYIDEDGQVTINHVYAE